MAPPPLILASASPRRAELLDALGIPFEVVTSNAEEIEDETVPPVRVAEINAERKAFAVALKHPTRIVLGADTVVALGGKLFGKPKDISSAESMLLELQGKTHDVITGVALVRNSHPLTFHDRTQVTFRPLTLDQIRDYLAKVNVLDKAGAYAIQEHGEMIIAEISGSYSNVVGLPAEKLQENLLRFISPNDPL